ncbi:hypothetical protein LJR045_000997 [Microbacterium sp. LjRoot45]|uniref:hypothetical protein n=1 Tax=Microbacterium sp. LjRoot45 TaxID=3342329 RepID=UPI003ECDCBFB
MTPAAADYTGELFVLGGIALTAILGWIGSLIVKRFREPTRIETLWQRLDALTKVVYGDEKDPGLLARMENAERRDASKGRIIRALSRQWPGDHVPRLNPEDLADLDEDTMPMDHPWRAHP